MKVSCLIRRYAINMGFIYHCSQTLGILSFTTRCHFTQHKSNLLMTLPTMQGYTLNK